MGKPPARRERTKHRNPGPMGGGGVGSGGPPARLRLDKKLGQHLLKNPGVLDKIVTAAGIKSSDTVLEIGPGTGNLTMRLLPLSRKVVAFDVDERMVNEVKKKSFSLGFKNLDVKYGDALRSDFGKFDVCTANLPYQISSPFVFRLLAHRPLFRCAVLMFQKEFAERLLASPSSSSYCRLSVNAQLFCKIDKVCNVAAGSFNPPPQVDSMVVKLTPHDPQPQVNFREWDGLMRILFLRKHRTLRAQFNNSGTTKMLEANFRTLQSLTADTTGTTLTTSEFKNYLFEALEECGVSQKRAADLPLEVFFQLLLAFNKRGIHFVGTAGSSGGAGRKGLENFDEFMFAADVEEVDEEVLGE